MTLEIKQLNELLESRSKTISELREENRILRYGIDSNFEEHKIKIQRYKDINKVISKEIADRVWESAGLEQDETINGEDHSDFIEGIDRLIESLFHKDLFLKR